MQQTAKDVAAQVLSEVDAVAIWKKLILHRFPAVPRNSICRDRHSLARGHTPIYSSYPQTYQRTHDDRLTTLAPVEQKMCKVVQSCQKSESLYSPINSP